MQPMDREHPPSREGLSDAEVWVWDEDGARWRLEWLPPDEDGSNEGGSPSGVET